MTIQIKALISFGLLVLLLAWLPWQELREAAHNITLGIWFAVLCSFLTGHAIGITTPLATWFLVWPLAKIAGLVPIGLGGLGVRDVTFAALLMPFGATATQALVTSLLWQTVLIMGGLVGGGVWWFENRRNRQSGARRISPGLSSWRFRV